MHLEFICADHGWEMATHPLPETDKENVINKALGVLVENGLYAMSVFLLSCKKADYGTHLLQIMLRLFKSIEVLDAVPQDSVTKMLTNVRSITSNLNHLLLARKAAEHALIFARYHCKALNGVVETAPGVSR